jgi:hypothetical protein
MSDSRSILHSKVKERTCEALGCFNGAEEEIILPVGQIGEISVSVCNNCKHKFEQNMERKKNACR